jgi:hypothetical protein
MQRPVRFLDRHGSGADCDGPGPGRLKAGELAPTRSEPLVRRNPRRVRTELRRSQMDPVTRARSFLAGDCLVGLAGLETLAWHPAESQDRFQA